MKLSGAQEQAIAARGNVLVIAGAGTGKTSTLAGRCLSCLFEEGSAVSLDEILIVTFTEAAAAEMRQRIRLLLEQLSLKAPGSTRLREQVALFETAHIGTLHSFCLQLVHQHFYELELDPNLKILPAGEAQMMSEEILKTLLEEKYAANDAASRQVHAIIRIYGHGNDVPISRLVWRIHHYAQALPKPAKWFEQQLEFFTNLAPVRWQKELLLAIDPWRTAWLDALQRTAVENKLARESATVLQRLNSAADRKVLCAILEELCSISLECPRGKRNQWLEPILDLFSETRFLLSLVRGSDECDPLKQDWEWSRGHMSALLKLTQEFAIRFSEAKRELGVVDFADLEQFALRLLWDFDRDQPTGIAKYWRRKLKYVFVDEYQDINTAQDQLIQALSREGPSANRFLVGDVKQSIYRFRLANPNLFQSYAASWHGAVGKTLTLADNFRSREGILFFVNSFFSKVMRSDSGGIDYSEAAFLRFGAREKRSVLMKVKDPADCVELHLRIRSRSQPVNEDNDSIEALTELAGLDEADKEARMVGLRLRALRQEGHAIWDEKRAAFRPVQWADMAILLRSPAHKAESYSKEFSRLGIPLLVGGGNFYESLEIRDLMNLMHLLDNPLQDLALLAVLRSPMVGLGLDELVKIRLAGKGPLWTTFQRWVRASCLGPSSEAEPIFLARAKRFLERFARWRRLVRQVSLASCLETVLSETHYRAWLLSQARGEQRQANLQRLLNLAKQYDHFQGQGLFRFLRFVEAQSRSSESEPAIAAFSEDDSVKLLSIHQSKGLEFPVVVLADLGKSFNEIDLKGDIILDEKYGLCPLIKPPTAEKRYPSLPYWLARQRQLGELLGEELRLLYVGMTRARDLLILSGTLSAQKWQQVRDKGVQQPGKLKPKVRSCSDWLAFWLSERPETISADATTGRNEFLRWSISQDEELANAPANECPEVALTSNELDGIPGDALQKELSWRYPFRHATREPAKTSVSLLRRRLALGLDQESPYLFEFLAPGVHPDNSALWPNSRLPMGKQTAVEVGRVHHRFLEFVSINRTASLEELQQEGQRMVGELTLTSEELALLDFGALAAFWNSEIGSPIRAHAPHVRRELPFTSSFSMKELNELMGRKLQEGLEEEFVIVQGIADLILVLPDRLWLLDFKTDALSAEHCLERAKSYAPQVRLYARALSRVFPRKEVSCWLYFLACDQFVKVTEAEAGGLPDRVGC